MKNDFPWIIRKFYPGFTALYEDTMQSLDSKNELIRNLREKENDYNSVRRVLNSINKFADENQIILGIEEGQNGEKLIVHKRSDKLDIYVYKVLLSKDVKAVSLFADYNREQRQIYIVDIQNSQENRNRGYGSVAMKYLLKLAKKLKVTSITGSITEKDYKDHGERLVHFYEKFGFVVKINNQGTGGSIRKTIGDTND